MKPTDAIILIKEAKRLGIQPHVRFRGGGRALRFTGDHWHVSFASAALALLREIPTCYPPLPG